MTSSARRLAITTMASVLLATSSMSAVADAQSPGSPTTSTDALGVMVALVGSIGSAIRAAADRPWVSPDDPYAVPLNLIPPLSIAPMTKARSYSDGCHVAAKVRRATGCDYGVTSSPVTVVILGDSHGSMWLPALELIAARKGWKIHLLTKSACPPPNLTVTRKGGPNTACDAWRASAFKVIKRLRPDMVIVASAARYAIDGLGDDVTSKRYFDTWRRGLADTLRILGRSAGQVVLFNDVAGFTEPPVECLEQHLDDVRACSTPRDVAIRPKMTRAYRQAAEDAGATFVDPSVLVCPGDPCPVVDGRYLVAYDTGHITPPYSRLISDQLEALLPAIAGP